jgi:hypothetical protein
VNATTRIGRFTEGLDALIDDIVSSNDVGAAIEALDHMDTARKRLDRMQANQTRLGPVCPCALHPNCTVCCSDHA